MRSSYLRAKCYTALQNLSVNQKKSEFHFVKQLRNGQQAHLWFHCANKYNGRLWLVGLYIGATAKAARKWYHSNGKGGITGNGSIEGLRWAMETAVKVITLLPKEDMVCIEGEDERRLSLYRKMYHRKLKELVVSGAEWEYCEVTVGNFA